MIMEWHVPYIYVYTYINSQGTRSQLHVGLAQAHRNHSLTGIFLLQAIIQYQAGEWQVRLSFEHNSGETTTLESSWSILCTSPATTFIIVFPISLDTSGELHHLCVASYWFPKGVFPKGNPPWQFKIQHTVPPHPAQVEKWCKLLVQANSPVTSIKFQMFGTWARRQLDLLLVMSCLSQCQSASPRM